MLVKLSLFVAGWLLLGCAASVQSVAPVPKEKPVIKCELNVTGNYKTIVDGKWVTIPKPDAGEVVVTNLSTETIDIKSFHGPVGHLDLRVKDPKGDAVKTKALVNIFSPQTFQPEPYLLKPGQSETIPVSLLVMLPEEKRVAGTYKVKAVYTFNKKDYESAEVEVKWPGEKK